MPAASRRAGQLPELQRPGHARRAAAAARPGWKETARSQRQPRPGLALVDLDAVRRSGAGRRRQFPRPGRAGTGQAGPARWWPPAALAGGLQASAPAEMLAINCDRAGGACPARAWQRHPPLLLALRAVGSFGMASRLRRCGRFATSRLPGRPISLPQPKPAAQDRCALLLCSRPQSRKGGLTAHGT